MYMPGIYTWYIQHLPGVGTYYTDMYDIIRIYVSGIHGNMSRQYKYVHTYVRLYVRVYWCLIYRAACPRVGTFNRECMISCVYIYVPGVNV